MGDKVKIYREKIKEHNLNISYCYIIGNCCHLEGQLSGTMQSDFHIYKSQRVQMSVMDLRIRLNFKIPKLPQEDYGG